MKRNLTTLRQGSHRTIISNCSHYKIASMHWHILQRQKTIMDREVCIETISFGSMENPLDVGFNLFDIHDEEEPNKEEYRLEAALEHRRKLESRTWSLNHGLGLFTDGHGQIMSIALRDNHKALKLQRAVSEWDRCLESCPEIEGRYYGIVKRLRTMLGHKGSPAVLRSVQGLIEAFLEVTGRYDSAEAIEMLRQYPNPVLGSDEVFRWFLELISSLNPSSFIEGFESISGRNELEELDTFFLKNILLKVAITALQFEDCDLQSVRKEIHVKQVHGVQQMVVWDCALVLSRFLERKPRLVRNRRVIELGCGIGLPGLVSSALGASNVILSERPNAIESIQQQIDRNAEICRNVEALALEWERDDENQWGQGALKTPFEVVLCSDLIYAGDGETTTYLCNTIQKLTKGVENAVVVCAWEQRHVGHLSRNSNSSYEQECLFTQLMSSICGFDAVESQCMTDMDEECSDDKIFINIFRKLPDMLKTSKQ